MLRELVTSLTPLVTFVLSAVYHNIILVKLVIITTYLLLVFGRVTIIVDIACSGWIAGVLVYRCSAVYTLHSSWVHVEVSV